MTLLRRLADHPLSRADASEASNLPHDRRPFRRYRFRYAHGTAHRGKRAAGTRVPCVQGGRRLRSATHLTTAAPTKVAAGSRRVRCVPDQPIPRVAGDRRAAWPTTGPAGRDATAALLVTARSHSPVRTHRAPFAVRSIEVTATCPSPSRPYQQPAAARSAALRRSRHGYCTFQAYLGWTPPPCARHP
jgi:hypothetical protein